MKTQSEKLAERNAKANRIRRRIGHLVGSPYRIHSITEGKESMFLIKENLGCLYCHEKEFHKGLCQRNPKNQREVPVESVDCKVVILGTATDSTDAHNRVQGFQLAGRDVWCVKE